MRRFITSLVTVVMTLGLLLVPVHTVRTLLVNATTTKGEFVSQVTSRKLVKVKVNTKCKKKQKGKIVNTKKYGQLKCRKIGKKYVWKKVKKTLTPATLGQVKIVAAGDIACSPGDVDFNNGVGQNNRCRQAYTADLIRSNSGYFKVLPLGDNQYESGRLSSFMASYEHSWGQFKNKTAPIPGNHEYVLTPTANDYFTYFNGTTNGNTNVNGIAGPTGKGWYSYDTGSTPSSGWHIIALNSQCVQTGDCTAATEQYQWLTNDLASTQKQCVLAYFHHPRFSSGGHGNNEGAKPLWDLLYQYQTDVVLNGHDHVYERFGLQDPSGVADTNGIREFIVGTGGKEQSGFGVLRANSEVRNSGTHGVLELTLNNGSYAWNFLRANAPGNGGFSDSGTTSCH